ncbi:LysR family transcriptional regulator ArgP [Streptomyces sp. NPDC014894]|uniref:LysR family transcriptional regulator ArgP n=1 Tax=Streptomyces sp. NPDC014894 TaxID=3364931 RepID=UPI0036F695F1
MMRELPFDQVRTLLAVIDEGTFEAAANVLHVTPSAVSQRVKALEQHTGRVLLIRSKPVRPTPSGEIVVGFARRVALLERETRSALGMSGSAEPTRMSIAVNSDSLATWFLAALGRVPEEWRLCYELRREDQDHTAALLRDGLVMAAVTSSPDAVAGCSARLLGHMRYIPVAQPRFAERELGRGTSADPVDLMAEALMVCFDRRDDIQDAFVRGLRPGRRANPRRHSVPTSEGFVDAVVAGMGWGMVPLVQAAPLLESGRLVNLVPGHATDIPLYWQQWKLDSPALAAVARAVAAEAAEALSDPQES